MTGQMVLQSTALAASDDDSALTKLLEDLAREHARLVYRIAYCVLRNHHDAEDVTQEVFLRAMRHKHKLSGLQEPKAWLARIAWRAAVARAGSRIRRAEFDLESIARQLRSAEPDPERLASGGQIQELLEQILASLPKKFREALMLSAIEDLSSREIAQILRIPETSVRVRIMRGRALLREKFELRLRRTNG